MASTQHFSTIVMVAFTPTIPLSYSSPTPSEAFFYSMPVSHLTRACPLKELHTQASSAVYQQAPTSTIIRSRKLTFFLVIPRWKLTLKTLNYLVIKLIHCAWVFRALVMGFAIKETALVCTAGVGLVVASTLATKVSRWFQVKNSVENAR